MDFWNGRRVLLTGHTGFKGAWAGAWLREARAEVLGVALPPETVPSLVTLLPGHLESGVLGDLRDRSFVEEVISSFQPELVLHMAAQSLVRRSYAEPVETFATNVMGTVNLLQELRGATALRAVLVITSDKVYENSDKGRAFQESSRLGGADPYSASKAATELVVSSFARTYFEPIGIPLATARAGNVIGGGDWSADRLVPDFWRARRDGRCIELRYPSATRPWQHVLEPLGGYLLYLERLATASAGTVPTSLNFGPLMHESMTVAEVVEELSALSGTPGWKRAAGYHPPEKALLAVDARQAQKALGWTPRLDVKEALAWTVDWYNAFDRGANMAEFTLSQIRNYQDRLF